MRGLADDGVDPAPRLTPTVCFGPRVTTTQEPVTITQN